jgi:hypothetical protein
MNHFFTSSGFSFSSIPVRVSYHTRTGQLKIGVGKILFVVDKSDGETLRLPELKTKDDKD